MFRSAKIAAATGVMLGMMVAGTAVLAAGGGGTPSSVIKCTLNDWECTNWSCDNFHGYYKRTCTTKINCTDVDSTRPPEKTEKGDDCNYPYDSPPPENDVEPACQADQWACDSWECTWYDNHQPEGAVRNCAHSTSCLYVLDNKPETFDSSCKTVPQESQPASMACTADDWTCTAWLEKCVDFGGGVLQAQRTCTRTRDCIDYNDTAPPVYQSLQDYCLPVDDKYSPGWVEPQQKPQLPQQQPQQSQQQEPTPQLGDGQAWPDTVALIKSSNKVSMTDLTPTSSIGWDKGLNSNPSQLCTGNTLIKTAAAPAVYYCGMDGKRYVFPNEKTYFSWYSGFGEVTTISTQTMSSIMIGGNVTYRPGMRMVKITSDPKVYAVAKGGILRPIASEAVAQELYGSDWNTKIDDISDAFFVNYTVGAAIDF